MRLICVLNYLSRVSELQLILNKKAAPLSVRGERAGAESCPPLPPQPGRVRTALVAHRCSVHVCKTQTTTHTRSLFSGAALRMRRQERGPQMTARRASISPRAHGQTVRLILFTTTPESKPGAALVPRVALTRLRACAASHATGCSADVAPSR